MATKITQTIKRFIFSYDWEIVEIEGAIFKIMWGIWLLLPFQTFRQISGYTAISTENIWGFGLLFLGLVHFGAITSGKIRLRRWITFIAFLFWLFTILLIFKQSPTAALLPLFAVIAFFMGLNFIRLGAVQEDRRREDLGAPVGIAERRHDNG